MFLQIPSDRHTRLYSEFVFSLSLVRVRYFDVVVVIVVVILLSLRSKYTSMFLPLLL